ncbi:hypothetical protein IW261DRAFT_1591412 [Armillaria novae-zelandiae]|uniref:DUF6534 domain-containing protein n=1 Tax=Armillaria novae-zelandiae TaxID=153914 RepID=A0AA39PJH9_9AGAR|nr:hypothetical protein IW261DRAFT_1591412 [Armillaria novae-zelandiae]
MEAIDINNTFGAMLIGALVTMAIYGITTLQAYFYFITYPQDSPGIKSYVGLIWVLDTVHVVLMCHTMHHYLIAGFGNPAYLVEGTWALFFSIMINVIVASLVQCFFVQQIHELCPKPYKWWMASVIGSIVFAHLCEARFPFPFPKTERSPPGFGLETVGQFFVRKEFSRLHEVNYIAILPFGITAILSDLLIALGLCFLLQRSRTNFVNTDYLIKILVRYAITRCLMTSLVAVVEVILAPSFYSLAVDFVIGKLWSNSLLASLNSRRSLRDTFNRKDGASMSASFRVGSPRLSTRLSTTGTGPGQISVVQISEQVKSRSSDEENDDPAEISTQTSQQLSGLRFNSVVDAQRTQ